MSLPTPMEVMTERCEKLQRMLAERDDYIRSLEFWQNCRKEIPELALKAARMGPEVYS